MISTLVGIGIFPVVVAAAATRVEAGNTRVPYGMLGGLSVRVAVKCEPATMTREKQTSLPKGYTSGINCNNLDYLHGM